MMLPETSYIEFRARRLRNAKLLYSGAKMGCGQDLLEQCGYIIPSELESEIQLIESSASLYAECYGGPGIGSHGGGVRCGNRGPYQIKGVGANQLCGTDTINSNFWHAHGGVNVAEAIQEAAWGEVFNHALPYGSVRVLAVISTATECWYEGEFGEKLKAPRALIVRPPVIRPAHFMRAIHFRSDGFSSKRDVRRVRAAIEHLPHLLPTSLIPKTDTGENDWERVEEGLNEMGFRFAVQAAAAHTKRLMHGAINASNIALDGRWLDYGTATSLPSHANTRSYGLPPHLPTLWEESLRSHSILREMDFYARKYLPGAPPPKPETANPLISNFEKAYAVSLSHSFLEIGGFLWGVSPGHGASPEYTALGELIHEIATIGAKHRFIPGVPDLEAFGTSQLGEILLTMARWCGHESCDSRLSVQISNAALRERFIRTYHRVFLKIRNVASNRGVSFAAVRHWLILHAIKARLTMTDLYRNQMRPMLTDKMLLNWEEFETGNFAQQFIDELSERAAIAYAPALKDRTLAWARDKKRVWYDITADSWIVTSSGHNASPQALHSDLPFLCDMSGFFGCDITKLLIDAESQCVT